ncbi:WbqC family protein [Spirosoma rigui]|uniref:WbqC family protein n=1 Tax=Spirosoma rigui TaxID=564064 RepID=UPI0009B0DE52|nr:WbqC family protein [Spirosoma rigui]
MNVIGKVPTDAERPDELLIDLHYLPCLDYITGLLQFRQVWIEANEHYQKQSYRNRCYVLTANKVDVLTVPVLRGTHHQPIREIRIDQSQNWQQHHWRCLKAAYGKAPFFEYYALDIDRVYQKNWTFLFDLNWELLTICLNQLGVKTPLHLTEWYEKSSVPGRYDARSMVNLRNDPESYVFYQPVPYPQNFGPDFVPNLSILDLLFCQGPAARDYIQPVKTVVLKE